MPHLGNETQLRRAGVVEEGGQGEQGGRTSTQIFARIESGAPHYYSPCLGMSYYVNFLGGLGSNEFHIK